MFSPLGWKHKLGLFLIGAWFLSPASTPQAQTVPGSSNVGEYDPALQRQSTYYRDLGPIMPDRRGQQGQRQEVRVLVKQGTKIYCAWSNQLLHNDVSFQEVTPEEASKFYDDGTHNDEIPFDGLPSSVVVNNYQYISPYAIAIKEKMERLKRKGLLLDPPDDNPDMKRWILEQREERLQKRLKNNEPEVDESKPSRWEAMDLWEPLRFYAGFHVASLDRKTTLPKFEAKLRDLTEFLMIFDQDVIEQFRGYEYYPDKENPDWERALWAAVEPEDPAVQKQWGLDPESRRRAQRAQEMTMMQGMYGGFGPGLGPGMW